MDYETFKNQQHPLLRALKVLLILFGSLFVLIFAWAQIDNLLSDSAPASPAIKPEPPVSSVDPLLAQVEDACPGLRRYREDWSLVKVDQPAGKVEILIGNPLKAMPFNYYAAGHHCFFEVGGERDSRVAVWKRPCVSACLDAASDAERSTLIEIK